MKISAVILNYNNSGKLANSIQAALKQTLPFDEVLIFDDSSQDNSVSVIKELISGHEHVRLVALKNNIGVNGLIELGIRLATSDYIYLMSAQHEYSLEIVKEFRKALGKFQTPSIIAANTQQYLPNGTIKNYRLPFEKEGDLLSANDIENQLGKRVFTFFGGGNILNRNELIEKKIFLSDLKWHADWYAYLMLALNGTTYISDKVFTKKIYQNNHYSDAMFLPELQKPVTREFIKKTRETFPREYQIFKNNGVLPIYNLNSLLQITQDQELRDYLTIRLVFLCVSYWTFKRISLFFPITFVNLARRMFRI